jgi:hypothetical protein
VDNPVRRSQAYALRLLADLHAVSATRRRALISPVADGVRYAAARDMLDAVLERALAADAEPPRRLASYLAAVDLILGGWDDDPDVAEIIRTAARAVVLHAEPEMREAFRVLYAPVAAHTPFESLLIG